MVEKEDLIKKVNKMHLGKILRYLRVSEGYTLEELSDRTGTQKYWLSSLETGKGNPKFSMLAKILAEYNLTLKEAFDLLDEIP